MRSHLYHWFFGRRAYWAVAGNAQRAWALVLEGNAAVAQFMAGTESSLPKEVPFDDVQFQCNTLDVLAAEWACSTEWPGPWAQNEKGVWTIIALAIPPGDEGEILC